MPGPPIALLLADDHFVVRHGLASILECEPDMSVVGHATTGRQAVDLYHQLHPVLLLLDLRMPDLDGFAVLGVLKKSFRDLKAIVMSCADTEDEVNRAFRLGAKSYLTKDMGGPLLIEAVRKVAKGETFVPDTLAVKLVDGASRQTLSDRENEILVLLARGSSNKEIARELFIAEGTVKSHVKRLLAKLDVSNRSEAAFVAKKRGLICPAESQS